MDLGGATLIHATAQPVCRVADGSTTYIVFAQTPNVPTEFVFDDKGLTLSSTGSVTQTGGRFRVTDAKPGTGPAIKLTTAEDKQIQLILLDDAQSLTCWKGTLKGREHIFLTPADLSLVGDTINLRAADPAALTVSVLPTPASLTISGKKLTATADGLFHRFLAPLPKATAARATAEPVKAAGPARLITFGAQHAATQPSDADFDGAAVWRIRLPTEVDVNRDLLLQIHYAGDVARLYLNGKFIDDNFYNGMPFEFGLSRCAPDIYTGELLLKILPLRKDAPIYIQKEAQPNFGNADTALALNGIDVIERHAAALGVGA